jgi:hypothetical protein
MIYDDLWWFMMIYDDLWWFMMIYDDLWVVKPDKDRNNWKNIALTIGISANDASTKK